MIIPMTNAAAKRTHGLQERASVSQTAEGTAMPIRQALQQRGRNAAAAGNFEEAAKAWREVLETKHDDPDAAFHLGEALHKLNKTDDAIAAFQRAAEHDPKSVPVKMALATALSAKGRHGEARAILDDVLALTPENQPARVALGVALRGLGKRDEASAVLERASKAEANDADAAYQWAVTLREAKRTEEAAELFRKVLQAEPEHRDARLALSRILHDANRFAEAVVEVQAVVDANPDHLTALSDLGSSLLGMREYTRAVKVYRHALSLQPQSAAVLCNFSLALFGLDRLEEGIEACRTALVIEPASSVAQFNMACMLLTMGRFEEGWAAYEYRFPVGNSKTVRDDITAAPWCGEDLTGKTILVLGEQANGDYLQFARYLPELEKLGAKVFFHLPKRLEGIFRGLPGSITLLPELALPSRYDYQIHLMSLPGRMLRLGRPIPTSPYLRAEDERVAKWRDRIGPEGFRIAIAWQGGVYNNQPSVRAFGLADMKPLAEVPGVRFISLQMGKGVEQIDALRGMTVETLGPDFDQGEFAFLDTAAVMECVDLVVTCDTSICHLAGGLGKPVWIGLNESPEWRWRRTIPDSVWYPSARLFRQKVWGDWDSVFTEMADALRQHLAAPAEASPARRGAEAGSPQVGVSWGECIDKMTILEIKAGKIGAPDALRNVRRELAELQKALAVISPLTPALVEKTGELRQVNETLWAIEDEIRECEARSDFGARFVELARSVYQTNDKRARLKREINALTNSALIEEKSYQQYVHI